MFGRAQIMAIGALLAAFSSSCVQKPTPKPIAAAFDMKRCVNMGNSLERPRDTSWGAPIDITKFQEIKAAGFDTVRMPVRWSAYTGAAPDYQIDTSYLTEVTTAVDAALSNGLNVILNVHYFDEIMANPDVEMQHLVEIWRQVGERFSDRSDNLWFEILNEPNDKLEGALMKSAQQLSYMAIRESNPERIVIFGGKDWSDINSLPSNIAPPDENVVYTVHYYDPFDFTHQFAPWVPQELVNQKRGWGSDQDKAELTEAVALIESFRAATKHPVFIGEFGVYDPVEPAERVEWVGAVRDAMEASETPWCLWSFSNTFALYNEETGWDEDMVGALGLTVPIQAKQPDPSVPRFDTDVLTRAEVFKEDADWGTFLKYFEGASWATENVLSGVAEIKPGWEIHPPHAHAEEEYLMILEGSGTWSVNGETFEAKAGDMLYAKPFDLHNVVNTGNTVLKFVFWKWTSSGVIPPVEPANE